MNVSRSLPVVIVLVLSALAGTAVPHAGEAVRKDPSVLHGTAKLQALIDQVTERQRSMTSMRAAFVQTKTSALLADVSEAAGEFSFLAPDRIRWSYESPDPMEVVVADGTVTTFHPVLGRAERVKISRRHSALVGVLAGRQSLDEMQARFEITLVDSGGSEPYRLTLKPLRRSMKKRLDSVFIEVDRQILLPTMVEYHEADGDATRYAFSGLEIDPQLEESSFRLEFGDDVLVENIDARSRSGRD